MKFLLSPLIVILVAVLLSVGVASFTFLKRLSEVATMAAAMKPKPPVIPSHLPDRLPPVDVASVAVSELRRAKDSLATQEAVLAQQMKDLSVERAGLELTRTEIDGMRKQVEAYLAEAKALNSQAKSESAANEVKNIKALVQTYSSMSPKSVVAIFREMEDAGAVRILALMKTDVVSGIFEEMGKQSAADPQVAKRAAKLADGLRTQRSIK